MWKHVSILFFLILNTGLLEAKKAEQTNTYISSRPMLEVPGIGPFSQSQCDNLEIIRRVCGLGGVSTPILADPTGIGLTTDDLERDEKSRRKFNPQSTLLTPEGIRRWKDSYEETIKVYEKLFTLLGEPYKSNFKRRMKSLEEFSGESLQQYFMRFRFVDTGPGALYLDISRKVVVMPQWINSQNLSKASMGMVLSHEIGHHLNVIDASQIGAMKLAKINQTRDQFRVISGPLIPPESMECFNNTFKKEAPEDYSDWLASIIINLRVQEYADPLDRLRYAQNSIKPLCGIIHNWGLFSKLFDSHNSPASRIVRYFRQPHLRAALGCSPQISEGGKKILSCTLPSAQPVEPARSSAIVR
jgi:hypothetical protein